MLEAWASSSWQWTKPKHKKQENKYHFLHLRRMLMTYKRGILLISSNEFLTHRIAVCFTSKNIFSHSTHFLCTFLLINVLYSINYMVETFKCIWMWITFSKAFSVLESLVALSLSLWYPSTPSGVALCYSHKGRSWGAKLADLLWGHWGFVHTKKRGEKYSTNLEP